MLDTALKVEIQHEKASFLQFAASSLLWAESMSPFLQYLFLYAEHIQYLAILYWGQFQFTFPSNYHSLLEIVPKVTGAITCQSIINSRTSIEIGATLNTLSYIYMLFFGLIFAVLIIYFKAQKELPRKLRIYINHFSHFHFAIGFWIINVILMNALSTSQNEESWENGLISFDVVHLFLIVFNYFVGAICVLLSYDPLTTTNGLSSHSPIFQGLTFLLKAFLAPITKIFYTISFSAWYFVICSMILCALRHYNISRVFPYYHFWPMKISMGFSSISILVSLTNLISLIIKKEDPNTSIPIIVIQILVIPFLLKLSNSQLENSILSSIEMKNYIITNETQVIKKLFALNYLVSLTSQSNNWSQRVGHADLKLWGALQSYKSIEEFQKENPLSKKETISSTFQTLSENITQNLLIESVKKIKSNKLKIILASKLSQNPKTINASLAYLSQISAHLGASRFLVIKLHRKIQKKVDNFYKENSEALDIKTYIDQSTTSIKFNKMLYANSVKFVEFWNVYRNIDLKIIDQLKKSEKIEKEDKKIKNFWIKYIEVDKKLASSLSFSYSIYLSLVRNAPYSAFTISETHPSFLSEKSKSNEDEMRIDETNLFSPLNMVFSVSMSKENLGKVLYVTPNITDLTGWTKYDILGNNISRLMPTEFKESHHQILLRHLDNISNSSYDSKLYKSLGSNMLTKSGRIVNCSIYIAVHPYIQRELVYIGFVRVPKSMKKKSTIETMTDRNFSERQTSKRSLQPLIKAPFTSIEATNNELLNTAPFIQTSALDTNISFIQKSKSRLLTINQTIIHQTSLGLPPLFELSFGSQINSKELPSHDLDFFEGDDEMKQGRNNEYDDISDTPDVPDEKNFIENQVKSAARSSRIDNGRSLIDNEKKELMRRKLTSYDYSSKKKLYNGHKSESSKPQINSLSMHYSAHARKQKQKIEHIIDLDKSVNGSLSSNLSSAKNYISKLEQGVYSTPKHPQIKLLRVFVLLFAVLASGLLIFFGAKNTQTFHQVQGNINVLSDSTLRLFRIVEVNRLTRVFPLIPYGILSPQRFAFFAPGVDARTLILPLLIENTQELYNYNNVIMQSLNKIDKSLQSMFYDDQIPIRVLEIYSNETYGFGISGYANMFDIVTRMVAAVNKIIITPYDELYFDNEDISLIILNSLDGVLTSGEKVLNILKEDNERKLKGDTTNIIILTCFAVVLSSAIFGYFIWLEKELTKRRNRIIDIFLRLDERALETRTILVNKFCQALEKDQGNNKISLRLDEGLSSIDTRRISAKELNIYKRRKASSVGLNIPIIMMGVYMSILLSLIISAFFSILIMSLQQNSKIIDKIELMMNSNLNLYNINLGFSALYEYVYSNKSSSIRAHPIDEEWNHTFLFVQKSQSYFFNLMNSDRIENSKEIEELVRGDLCKVFYNPDADLLCQSFSGGILTKGIIGGTSALTSTLKSCQESFERSSKDISAMFNILSDINLVQMDVIAELYLFPAFEKIDHLIKDQLLRNVDSFIINFVLMVALFILFYSIFGLLLWIRIQRMLKIQRNGWRRMIRLIPHNMIFSNKMLKDYLIANSNGVLESIKRYFQ